MANSTAKPKYCKPRPDFGHFPRQSGRWCKKNKGRFCYFGKIEDDPQGKKARQLWLDQRADLEAGRDPQTPGLKPGTLPLCVAANHFLAPKDRLVESGELSSLTAEGFG